MQTKYNYITLVNSDSNAKQAATVLETIFDKQCTVVINSPILFVNHHFFKLSSIIYAAVNRKYGILVRGLALKICILIMTPGRSRILTRCLPRIPLPCINESTVLLSFTLSILNKRHEIYKSGKFIVYFIERSWISEIHLGKNIFPQLGTRKTSAEYYVIHAKRVFLNNKIQILLFCLRWRDRSFYMGIDDQRTAFIFPHFLYLCLASLVKRDSAF